MSSVGFIGLGNMGFPMAANLCRAGFDVCAFDTDGARVDRVVAAGARRAASALEAASNETLITMLPDGKAVRSVVLGGDGAEGVVGAMPRGSTLIDMSSSDPLGSRQLAAILAERGIGYLDAPVSGGVPRAKSGTLSIIVGGSDALFERHRTLFSALGNTITRVGDAGAGHALKALNNYVSACGLLAAIEAIEAGRRFGLDPAVMTDVLNASTGRNNSTELKIKQHVLSRAFGTGFSLGLMRKDIATALALVHGVGAYGPLAESVDQIWGEAQAKLGTNVDHTAIALLIEDQGKSSTNGKL
jgi:3-hydroxyisobutyrate dehydrogenase